jgi:hypothetical protein
VTEELGAPKKFAKERQVGVGILHLLDELGDREKPGAERIAILGLGPGDYRGACLLRQVETMF